MRSLLAALSLALLLPAVAQASIKEDLYRQVKSELRGDPRSCSYMSETYQGLFIEAGRALGGAAGCSGGVEALFETRKALSGKYFSRQVRRQSRAVLRARIYPGEERARLVIRYKGTPPGWKFRPGHRTRETFWMLQGEARWLTDQVSTTVRPPIATPVD